jgi:Domain of unknown function (DUF4434)
MRSALFVAALAFACGGVGCGSSTAGRTPEPAASRPATCPGGIDATFVQIQERELDYGREEWSKRLAELRALGIATVVLQFSGDERGAYDERTSGRRPVKSLFEAADVYGVQVYLGLFAEPSWPARFDVARAAAPPLGDPAQSVRLAELCRRHRSCVGFYLPEEIDDKTWGRRPDPDALRGFLERSAARLRELAPQRPLAAAPFYTGSLDPEAHAAFWSQLLKNRPLDVLMLQDGLGAGHATEDSIVGALSALHPAVTKSGVELWTVLEVFRLVHGPPRDDLPFEARPAPLEEVLTALARERRYAAKTAAFTVLNYMSPDRGPAAHALREQYRRWCERGARHKR